MGKVTNNNRALCETGKVKGRVRRVCGDSVLLGGKEGAMMNRVLSKLAVNMQRNDEKPNIELAEFLVNENDVEGITEIVQGLRMNKGIANDCIKVLYEIGERKPLLIAEYVSHFIDLLGSKNNRIIWGSMTALATIAEYKAQDIYMQIDKVKRAYEKGSVITVDNSISVFAKLCKASKEYEEELFPFLIVHLEKCRPKEVAQHAERISVCINDENIHIFINTLEKRKNDLTKAQVNRINKLIKDLCNCSVQDKTHAV